MAHRAGRSIRRTVLVWQLLALLLLGVAAMAVAYGLAARSFAELRDIELDQIADAVARHGIDDEDAGSEQPGDFLSQLWEADGRLSYASHEPPLPFPERMGVQDFDYGGQVWHGLAARYQGQTVVVAREVGPRGRLLARLSLPLLAALLGLTLVLMLVLAMRMRRALQPLESLRAALAQRPPSSLDAVHIDHAPTELQPLIATLNDLFARVNALLETQGRFTADAAHQLRTPLTAIGLYAQLAQQGAGAGDIAAAEAVAGNIDHIRVSCQRAAALVEQLLTLARLDENTPAPATSFALDELLMASVAELSVVAEAGNVDLGIVAVEARQVRGDAGEWRMLLDNLIGNAVRYTPPGGRVDVSLHTDAEGFSVLIDDTGPGIPETELGHVFDRFHRLAGNDKPGSGLGLAIVARIAARQGVVVTLHNRIQGDASAEAGLRAHVRWPAPVKSQPLGHGTATDF